MINKVKGFLVEVSEFNAKTYEEIEAFRIKFLGKKGILNDLFAAFKNVASEDRKEFGQFLNTLKNNAQEKVTELKKSLENSKELKGVYGDLTKPEEPIELGARHPISIVRNKIIDVFSRVGFNVSEGPEIEDDWHNFTALNLPEYHPARDMQDTFFY
jgi:phenylalanyl-tRNA synthetase alpha chain